jgi:DNA-binding transcriptional MerR regulator
VKEDPVADDESQELAPEERPFSATNPLPEPTLTIAQVSEVTGLTTDTLRYYEKAGLIERVGRTTGNQRRYASADLARLEFLLRLRETGMTIADTKRFAQLRAEEGRTIGARIEMLRAHAESLAAHIHDLQQNAHALGDKVVAWAFGEMNVRPDSPRVIVNWRR